VCASVRSFGSSPTAGLPAITPRLSAELMGALAGQCGAAARTA
jgi:hypothetical protein